MNQKDLTITDNQFIINTKHCNQSPGLNARKIWETLFRHTDIKEAGNYDSFLCDLDSFIRLLEKLHDPVIFYWQFSGSCTEITEFFIPNCGMYRIVVAIENQEIIITKPTEEYKK